MEALEALGHGVRLMVVGMVFVMVFLTLLIYAIAFVSRLINGVDSKAVALNSAPKDEVEDLAKKAALVAAVHHHRQMQ